MPNVSVEYLFQNKIIQISPGTENNSTEVMKPATLFVWRTIAFITFCKDTCLFILWL